MAVPSPLLSSEIVLTFSDIIKVCGGFISIVGVLASYIWIKQDKSIGKLSDALEHHIEANDEIHDKLFTDTRKCAERISTIEGAHSVNHK